MTCRGNERRLALFVEGDLPESESQTLAAHLAKCEGCRAFHRHLEDSQRVLKALADEPADEEALRAVRTRVLDATASQRPSPGDLPAWSWALAATVAVVALVGAAFWRGGAGDGHPIAPTPAPVVTKAQAEAEAAPPDASVPDVRAPRSTFPSPPPVSQGMEPTRADTSEMLSPEEADQLARALVVLAQIERLSDIPTGDAPDTGTARVAPGFVRWVTDSPNVTIYWQLESSGGES